MGKLKIFNVKWSSEAAGPSPDNNQRTELFLAGCQLAANGTPCKGCFNADLWESDTYIAELDVESVAENIRKYAPNDYLTIVGGEPLDQYEALVELCEELKNPNKRSFHILIITHYEMLEILREFPNVLKYADVIIDGVYDERQRIFDHDARDGLHNVVGSANQIIWDLIGDKFYKAGELTSIGMDPDTNHLIFCKGA